MAKDGPDMAVALDKTWRFNAEGKVAKASPALLDGVADAFRTAGVQPKE